MCVTSTPAGEVTKLVGFDLREPTGHQGGKPLAIARLRELFPYETVVMVGDGITDLEAVQQTGGADMFVGFGGEWRHEARGGGGGFA
jgi:phosphoglycolate phosphatase-like HAD superfamily hydrolase